jgi:hypothetical protein
MLNLKNQILNISIFAKLSGARVLASVKNYFETSKYLQKILRVSFGQSRGDVPGWVLVVLMTTALVTGIWSIAAPKLTTILRNSLDAMAGIK